MFSAKPYHQVNREERCYVALMAHALLLSSQARTDLCRLIANRTTPRLELDPTHLEVYVEAACLRDYWRDLGSAVIYNNATHTARRNVLEEILQAVALSPNVLDTHGVFWTSGQPNQGKLWSPGRWNEQALMAAGLASLIEIKRVFNVKPDLMLVSGTSAVLIEAKLESGEGPDQVAHLHCLAQLLELLLPSLGGQRPAVLTLKLQATDGLRWKDALEACWTSDLDAFTKAALGRLPEAYPAYFQT